MKAKRNKNNKQSKMTKGGHKTSISLKPGKKIPDKKTKLKMKKMMDQKNQKKLSKGSYKYSVKKLMNLSLRDRMLARLKASRFRFINEQLYTMKGQEALNYFKSDREAFDSYHKGYQKQVDQWPINPIKVVIESIKKMNKKNLIIADFGCGDATLAKSIPYIKVHSFDLVSLDPCVTVCDMAKTPLEDSSVDIVVFCLSLMGTNFSDYLVEANRVLKVGGALKIAEVESRFEDVKVFIRGMTSYGFSNTSTNFSHDLFCFMDFKKDRPIGKNSKKKLVTLTLKPCLYKRR